MCMLSGMLAHAPFSRIQPSIENSPLNDRRILVGSFFVVSRYSVTIVPECLDNWTIVCLVFQLFDSFIQKMAKFNMYTKVNYIMCWAFSGKHDRVSIGSRLPHHIIAVIFILSSILCSGRGEFTRPFHMIATRACGL